MPDNVGITNPVEPPTGAGNPHATEAVGEPEQTPEAVHPPDGTVTHPGKSPKLAKGDRNAAEKAPG